MDTNDIRRLRLQLLANGWTPIRNHDKRTFMTGWPNAEITPEAIDLWSRKFKRQAATGLRVDGELIVADQDIDDAPAMAAIDDELNLVLPKLRRALRRTGKGAKQAWFLRCEDTFTRLHSRGWTRPGENHDEHEVHRIEIFGSGGARQFGAFGPHTLDDHGNVLVEYGWIGRSPADARLDELPILTKDECHLMVDTVERTLAGLGWSPVLLSTTGENEASHVHDLIHEMRFDIDPTGRLSLRELRERAEAVGSFRCSAGWYEPGSVNRTRCRGGIDKNGGVYVHDHATGVTHHEAGMPDTYPGGPQVTPDLSALGAKLKAAGLIGDAPRPKVVLSTGDTAGRTTEKLLDLYAHCADKAFHEVLWIVTDRVDDGMDFSRFQRAMSKYNRTVQRGDLQVLQKPAAMWLASNQRKDVAGSVLRPDKPAPLFEEEGRRWINTFYRPVHDAAPEGEAVFDAFMKHLLPTTEEREWQLDCLAHKWMHPEVPGPGVIHVAQYQGTGRGTFFSMVTALFGGEKYVRKVDGATLTGEGSQGQYNRFLAGSLVVTVDEVLSSDGEAPWKRRVTYERLKLLIDPAPRLVQIVQKNQNNYDAMVYASLYMATNHKNALPMDEDDRRIGVLTNGGRMPEAMKAALQPFRLGSGWSPGFLAMLARKLERRAAASLFDPYAAPPNFAGKVTMIQMNGTDVMEVADQAILEMPGDYVTRKDFLERVRTMMGDAAREHKNLNGEAISRLDRAWISLGREKIKENGSKADVWARDEQSAWKWRGSAVASRVTPLLTPNSNPRAKATETQMRMWANKINVVKNDDNGGQ